ncbi:hypothetical protein G9F73_012565 [Clostridium estertheticum]|uniref:hypothetical protein n=1 Tax=Clostridium estertheticum TaxID=238834 RepID=UPI0013EEE462|nr:hypothetical protein [Clostridium estertheticum]MBZ9608642.1 hypothetical protein [Clostridium estertheticum]
MLDNNSLIVLAYLKNHFAKSDKMITALDLNIPDLSTNDIETILETLDSKSLINVTDKNYIRICVTGMNI